ncbi:nuclear envelope integral membrane protein 1-like isoform X2 [Amphiura filiformis]|uniref:nuclear envelope integral membrane protein 1-like isoform X2 n=1 Tax=Amphiura filiformis TaxID=82378 RepID=UPI003B2186A3
MIDKLSFRPAQTDYQFKLIMHPPGTTMISLFLLSCILLAADVGGQELHHDLEENHSETIRPTRRDSRGEFHIFCHVPEQRWQWLRIWSSLTVTVKPLDESEKLLIIDGMSTGEVIDRKEKSNSWRHIYSRLSPWSGYRKLSPFNNSCLGIQSTGGFRITSTTHIYDLQYLCTMLFGIILFFVAPRLSGNFVFHYSAGVTIGVLASLLVLVYVLSRFIPRKTGAISVLVGGWAFCLYILNWVVSNFLELQYKEYLIGYVVCTGLVSFAVCYYFGPVTNHRTVKLLQWSLQLIGLLCVYGGTHHDAAAVIIIVSLICLAFVPDSVMNWVTSFGGLWKRRPKLRLLSPEEFEEQAREETRKALADLREYCRSPQCDPWKMVARLESPKRFADFVAGEAHLSRNEISAYDTDLSMLDDDSHDSDSSISITEIDRR